MQNFAKFANFADVPAEEVAVVVRRGVARVREEGRGRVVRGRRGQEAAERVEEVVGDHHGPQASEQVVTEPTMSMKVNFQQYV